MLLHPLVLVVQCFVQHRHVCARVSLVLPCERQVQTSLIIQHTHHATPCQTIVTHLPRRRMAGQWKQALITAGRLGYDRAAVCQLAVEMGDELAGPMAQPGAAAQLLLAYTGDIDNSVALFARARWAALWLVLEDVAKDDAIVDALRVAREEWLEFSLEFFMLPFSWEHSHSLLLSDHSHFIALVLCCMLH